jgi:hypothetical protein
MTRSLSKTAQLQAKFFVEGPSRVLTHTKSALLKSTVPPNRITLSVQPHFFAVVDLKFVYPIEKYVKPRLVEATTPSGRRIALLCCLTLTLTQWFFNPAQMVAA